MHPPALNDQIPICGAWIVWGEHKVVAPRDAIVTSNNQVTWPVYCIAAAQDNIIVCRQLIIYVDQRCIGAIDDLGQKVVVLVPSAKLSQLRNQVVQRSIQHAIPWDTNFQIHSYLDALGTTNQ